MRPILKPFLLASSVLLFVAACGSSGSEVVAATEPATPAAEDADCNLSTPLVPGIPGSPGHLIPSPRNPNGDSELATIMRMFVDDLRDARVLVEAGEPVKKMHPRHRRMRCAWPTVPSDRNEKFDGLAQLHLQRVKAFDDMPSKITYNGIIDGCVACHDQSCGGPLEFIGSMRWQ